MKVWMKSKKLMILKTGSWPAWGSKPQDRQGLQQFNPDTVEEFNRFDIALKELHPGLVDLIDYDAGTITIVKTL
jgi:hypothetical protein